MTPCVRWLLVVAVLLVPTAAVAVTDQDAAHTFTTYTLNSLTYAPGPTGEDLRAYDGRCTIQLVVTSGEIRVNVEGSLVQQDGTALGFVNTGTLSGSTIQNLNGPMDLVRLNTTCCETDCGDGAGGAGSCLAKAVIRCRIGS